HPGGRIEEPAAIVAHLVDHHVVGGLAQDIRHLVCIGDDGAAHHFHGNRVCPDGFHACPQLCLAKVITRCPCSVTSTSSPGWTSVVEFGSSITAGPVKRNPAGSVGRQ